MKNIQIILAGATLFIGACICGSTSSTPPIGETATGLSGIPVSTPTPKSAALGTTRDKPFPVNTVVDIGGGIKVSIVEVTRPANDIVIEGNQFNDTPVPNQEYLIVKLHVECTKSSNEKCSFDDYEFKTVGADGQVHDKASVAGVPEEFELYAEFFGGASIDGNIAFLVTQNDSSVVLFHEPLIFGDPVYIALQ